MFSICYFVCLCIYSVKHHLDISYNVLEIPPLAYFGNLLQLNFDNSLTSYCVKGFFDSCLIKMVWSVPLTE